MLFATIGAIWTICILCIAFVAVYLYNLHHNRGVSLDYAWDAPRLWMLYILGIAVFYLGTARLANALSGMLMHALNQHPIPLLFPEQWLSLAAMCSVIAFMIGLLNRGERIDLDLPALEDNDLLLLPEIRALPKPVIAPKDATTYLEPVRPLAAVNILDDEPLESRHWGNLRSGIVPALLTTAGVGVLAVIAWFVFSQPGLIFNTVGQVDSVGVSAESQQILNPEIGAEALGAVVNADPAGLAIAAKPTDDLTAAGNPTEAPSPAPDPAANVEIAETSLYTSSIPISFVVPTDTADQNQVAAATSVRTAKEPGNVTGRSEFAVDAPAGEPVENGTAESNFADTNNIASTSAEIVRTLVVVPGGSRVNTRFSPTTESAIIEVLPDGAAVPLIEWSPNREWILVKLDDGRNAWVASWVVDVVTRTS